MKNPYTNEEMKKKRRHRTRKKRNTWLLNLQPSGSITDAENGNDSQNGKEKMKTTTMAETMGKTWRKSDWIKKTSVFFVFPPLKNETFPYKLSHSYANILHLK